MGEASRRSEVRARLRVRGRVQGVWYRGWTREQALSLGLVGHARNLDDGTVEVLVQGPADAVDRLASLCAEGPPSAHVEDMHRREEPAAGDLTGFRIL